MLNGYVYVDGYKIDQLLDKSKWYFLHWTHDETQGEGVSEKLCLDTNCTTIPSNTSIQAEMKVTFGNFSGLMKNAFLFNILLKPDYRVAMDMCHAYCPDDGFRLTNETKYSNDFGSSVLVNSSGVRFKKSNKHVYAYLSAPDGSLTLPNRCPEVFTLYVCFKPKNGSSNLKRSLVTWSTGSPNDPQIYSLDKNIGYLSHHPIKKFPTNDWNFIEWTKYYTNKERVCFDQKCTEINDGGVYNNGTNCNLVIGSGGYEGFVKNVYLFDKPLRVQNRWLRDVCTESHIHEARSRFPKMTLDELCELWTYGWPFAKPCHKGRFASGDVIKHQKFDLDVTYVEARKNCLALGMSLLNAAKCLNTEAMDDYPTEFWRHTANKEDNITDCSTFSKHATDDEFIKTTHPCDQKLPFVCIQSYYRFPSRTSTVLHDHSRRRRGNCIFPENDGEATYGCMFDPADCD
ncbi:uncharacterized protein LOC141907552 [Tubulanus polymorphus]|uniref:uncharacterized protein LOC141907552 n=1 Tax=Tubulanus polymorphus TaxID=672921 RepID=UPI003DA69C42